MEVRHVQLSREATGSEEVVAGAEGADLGAPIGPHGAALARQAVAVQHLLGCKYCQNAGWVYGVPGIQAWLCALLHPGDANPDA